MTKKLEDFFNLEPKELTKENVIVEMQPIHDAIALRDKIDTALESVSNFKEHDIEMDDIAKQAIASYTQLMSVGMNMTDMAAGNVFGNAAQMLKIAKEAKDSKVDRKLKQVDMMLKKLRLDQQDKKDDSSDGTETTVLDRNELLAAILGNTPK